MEITVIFDGGNRFDRHFFYNYPVDFTVASISHRRANFHFHEICTNVKMVIVQPNSSIFKVKRTAKQLSYRSRYRAMTSNEQVRARKYRNLLMLCFALKNKSEGFARAYRWCRIFYLSLVLEDPTCYEELLKPGRKDISIEGFSESNCRPYFRFLKADLTKLFELLRFPDWFIFPNKSKMKGEEVFLRGLFELATGMNKHIICETVFGREFSAQSRAFTAFINHLFNTFKHLVFDSLNWWHRNGYFRASAEAIIAKMYENGYPPDMAMLYLVGHFIDCNCLPTSVVGGGPAEDGRNAARWDEAIQRAFYNGWKSIHGLKHQTVDNAYGITVDIAGPTSLRRNDLTVLRISDINDRMAQLQGGDAVDDQVIIFGDSAYPTLSHLRSYYKGEEQYLRRKWNSAMKKVRISIEWNYGYTASLFRYLCNHQKLKLKESSTVTKVYVVTTLLRNFHAILYGCQTSNYFNVAFPNDFINHYINQTNMNNN